MGKTTLVRRVAERLAHRSPAGFYTAEIREGRERRGFEIVTLDGSRGILAHVDIRGPRRVGRYGVDVDAFERLVEAIPWPRPGAGLSIIDEIGRMECFSARFQALVREILDAGSPLLATVALHGGGLIEEVKRRPGVELLEISPRNRDRLSGEIARRWA